MKRTYIIMALLIVMVASLSAKAPVYVDLEEANQQISDLQAQIDAANTQNSELNSENDALDQNTLDQQDKIAQARGIIDDLRVSRGELYGARNRANDVEQKKRIIEQLEKNMAQEYQLEMMIDKFNGIINDNNIQYSANRKQIARNEIKIEQNTDEVAYLNACVELTSGNEGSLSDIFSRQDQASSSFDSFMSANQ
jgi:chromosome segregation ATPase